MTICIELEIRSEADVALARYRAGEAAIQLGFSNQRRAEVRIIASELAHNHLDHKTSCGIIHINGVHIAEQPVLTISSLDQGPGIDDLAAVLRGAQGGYHSNTGLGTGLASVARLADRFSCCSGKDPQYACPSILDAQWQGTVIIARCCPERQPPGVFNSNEVDLAALVCGHSETLPCGDGIFTSSDSRFLRIVMVDSPGKGRGGGETELIGSMLAGLNLIWPPDHVMESLSGVFTAEPSTAVLALRIDRFHGEVRCCRTGNIGIHLLIDDQLVSPSKPLVVEGGGLIRGTDNVYKVASTVSCLLHSDGIRSMSREQAKSLLTELALNKAKKIKATDSSNLDSALMAQILFSRNRHLHDDAALCLWRWQKK